ncbi:uncharacterized protein TNCV_4100591 [Trichonephila clavipes]|nr:uncharacterized protein TNCV_4100591 [Trichonephila clavipes]
MFSSDVDIIAEGSQPQTTRGLLATNHVTSNYVQVMWTTSELAPLSKLPLQRKDISALDRFNMHRCPAQLVFSGTGLELVTKPATIRYLDHWASTALIMVVAKFYENI